MKLYQINLPRVDNRGATYELAHVAITTRMLDVAGGYTRVATFGQWHDIAGDVFNDECWAYQVACEPEQWAEITAHAKRLFADQVCLFVATLGEAELI